MTDIEIVRLERHDGVAIVTLNRPSAANAVNAEVTQALGRIAAQVEAEPEFRAAVLTGAGEKAFCAGADLKTVASGRRADLYDEAGGFGGFVDLPRTKLWIAAVDAPALAGGLELALSCDVIISGRTARFGLPEVTRGLVAAAGGVFRLPLRVGSGAALKMIASGEPVTAAEAFRIGLVDELVEAGTALGAAVSLATRVARNAPIAVQESLGVARLAQDCSIEALRDLSAAASLRNARTDDFLEGPRAFIEKRPPQWTGR